jgi:transaldolase
MQIKIYADGASAEEAEKLIQAYGVRGFTTNPTLMAKAGVSNYLGFAEDMARAVGGLPLSIEVIADEFGEMERQAEKISGLGDNIFVKIPITDCSATSSVPLIGRLHESGVQVNVTAVFTERQIDAVMSVLTSATASVVSVFAGRIADAGTDPAPIIAHAAAAAHELINVEVLWASPREIFNVVQAEAAGADIITVPYDLLPKVNSLGKDLDAFSLETVRMFYGDAVRSGYDL